MTVGRRSRAGDWLAVPSVARRTVRGKAILPRVQKTDNPRTEGTSLIPSAVGQGRVVGGGRSEMPVFIRGVETSSVPEDAQQGTES